MFKDRVYETSTSTGQGNFTLAGAPTGYQTFSAAFGSAAAYYLISNTANAAEWEIGSFTVSGSTLARTAGNVLSGSAGAGTLVNFSAGTKNVFNIVPAAALASVDNNAIWTAVRQNQYTEYQSANCGGTIPTGNCNSNSLWSMPDANWWTWTGVTGLSMGNPNSYYYLTTPGYTALSQTNVKIYGNYSLYQTQVRYDVYQRAWWNCNCGATNCWANCNCACDCDCACAC